LTIYLTTHDVCQSKKLTTCYRNKEILTRDWEGREGPCHGSLLLGRCLEIRWESTAGWHAESILCPGAKCSTAVPNHSHAHPNIHHTNWRRSLLQMRS